MSITVTSGKLGAEEDAFIGFFAAMEMKHFPKWLPQRMNRHQFTSELDGETFGIGACIGNKNVLALVVRYDKESRVRYDCMELALRSLLVTCKNLQVKKIIFPLSREDRWIDFNQFSTLFLKVFENQNTQIEVRYLD